jgi:hypothetical protein
MIARNTALLCIAGLLAILVLRPYLWPEIKAAADVARFDYIYVVSPAYVHQGRQGILILDKRNGNVWFIPKGDNINISFRDPVFVVRLPLEKVEHTVP